jgi:hypothetical protein
MDSRFEPLNRPLSRLRHPLPLKGGEGKGEGAVHFQSRFMGRENPRQRAVETEVARIVEYWPEWLPLPEGEGWGEGKEGVIYHLRIE